MSARFSIEEVLGDAGFDRDPEESRRRPTTLQLEAWWRRGTSSADSSFEEFAERVLRRY